MVTTVEEYRPDLDQWTSHLDMPSAVTDAAAAVLGSEIILVGGLVDDGSSPAFLDRARAATPSRTFFLQRRE
jgi:hypothetical protein